MNKLIFYSSYDVFLNGPDIPGGKKFKSFFKIFSTNINAMDRTNTIQIPLNYKIQHDLALTKFIDDAFDSHGQYIDKEYDKKPSKSNCMFCDFKGTEHCHAGVLGQGYIYIYI